jgi:hypothetical protein
MSSTERVRVWRAEQRRKAKLYDEVEAARIARLQRQALGDWPSDLMGERYGWRKRLLDQAVADQTCFDIFDKA